MVLPYVETGSWNSSVGTVITLHTDQLRNGGTIGGKAQDI